jgi:phosphoribosylanthranilate isomerase
MALRIKICGITSVEDARAAVAAGADALGFMFYEGSPRAISKAAAIEIIRELPPFVARVGVFVNPTEKAVIETMQHCGLDTLQFHGEEPPEFCRAFGLRVVKAFRMRDAASLEILQHYDSETWLLDSFVPDKLGGTGARFNWDLAVAAGKLGRPIILAGGLNPENVAQAVKHVRPYAVDVSSGVEMAPGKKDPARIRAFIAAARQVE